LNAPSDALAALDRMPAGRVAALLAECCASSRWVTAMVSRRPYATAEALHAAAREIWRSLDGEDWLEAFAHHPRIGSRASDRPQGERGEAWSAGEQAGVDAAQRDVVDELAKINRAYEQRFGFIYIVCATGLSAEEMLAMARARMQHSVQHELTVAAEEQSRITALRLDKLLAALAQNQENVA
jgi:OHCU decarboxylase